MKNIAQKIKALRKQRGFNQEEVAKAIGMSKANLSKIENGDIAFAPDKLEILAKFFEITPEELLSFETLQEKLGIINDQPSLEEIIKQQAAQIKRMQQATERYIESQLKQFENPPQQVKQVEIMDSHEDKVTRSFAALFSINGIEHLLNGENTSPDYLLVEEYKNFKKAALLVGLGLFAKNFSEAITKKFKS